MLLVIRSYRIYFLRNLHSILFSHIATDVTRIKRFRLSFYLGAKLFSFLERSSSSVLHVAVYISRCCTMYIHQSAIQSLCRSSGAGTNVTVSGDSISPLHFSCISPWLHVGCKSSSGGGRRHAYTAAGIFIQFPGKQSL